MVFPKDVWSANLPGASPHLRFCEVLQLPIHLVQIKGLRIKLAPDPFQHLLVLGVLWIAHRFEQTGVAPDATAILGGTGTFPGETDGVALPRVDPRVEWQPLFHKQLVVPAIPEIVLVE